MTSPMFPAPALAPLPCVLLTGFDAFGGAAINPSWLAVQALDQAVIAGHRVVAAQLPTVFESSLKLLRQLLLFHQPALVICVGQAGGRAALSLERVAINISDASMADNAGWQPLDTPVAADGPAAYFSTLPIKAIVRALQHAGLPAEVSQSAGTFVCNHVFYGLMHELANAQGGHAIRAGFMHVPFVPEQGEPSLTLMETVRGLRLAVELTLSTCAGTDAAVSAMAISQVL